jgi:hypothetical protein
MCTNEPAKNAGRPTYFRHPLSMESKMEDAIDHSTYPHHNPRIRRLERAAHLATGIELSIMAYTIPHLQLFPGGGEDRGPPNPLIWRVRIGIVIWVLHQFSARTSKNAKRKEGRGPSDSPAWRVRFGIFMGVVSQFLSRQLSNTEHRPSYLLPSTSEGRTITCAESWCATASLTHSLTHTPPSTKK